jgi:ABC-type multidrug transport system permease subunit
LRKDWQSMRRNPVEILIWLGIPLAIGGLITLASGGREGPRPVAHVLVVDNDESFLSDLLVGAMSQSGDGIIQGESVPEAEGRRRIGEGDGSALLVIPEGFGMAVLEEKPTSLQLLTNPAERILPGIVEESLNILVDATFYVHRLIGDDLRRFAEGPATGDTFPDSEIADFSIKINRLVQDLEEYISPVLIQVKMSSDEEKKTQEEAGSSPGFAVLFLPSILYMSLLFMCSGLAEDLWKEKDQQTLRRVLSTPQTVRSFLFGKMLWGFVLMLAVSTLALTIGFLYFGLDPSVLPLGILWTVFSGSLLLLLMILLQIHASSKRAADVLAMSVLFPLMMIGGNFFPLEVMPTWMARIGRYTPNGWSMQQLKTILLDTVQVPELLMTFLALLAMWLILFFLSVRRIRTGFVRG